MFILGAEEVYATT